MSEGGTFDRLEQGAPAALARRRHRLVVQLGQQRCDRLVQFAQREELAMAQRGQQPATRLQHAVLDARLGVGRQLRVVWGQAGQPFASPIHFIRLPASRSNWSAGARIGGRSGLSIARPMGRYQASPLP